MQGRQGGNMSWLRGRETGLRPSLGHSDQLSNMLYSSMDVQGFWGPKPDAFGGIFNFDFATDGSVLVATCERKGFIVFDPANYKPIKLRGKAHEDCVNCVRFLDTRSFVTCSDDTTVVLWDLRYLKNCVRSLKGHSNWVKNIEYASSLGLLVTSGFDGTVYTWNINNYANEEECKRVFYTEGLMRCKLTPDDSKLIISTSLGYLLIIHDLDLNDLDINMDVFNNQNTTWEQIVSSAADFNSLFERQKNRLEIVNDFPEDNRAEIIASLQVHPQGWCVASRNTGVNESVEWTCIHDIHTQPLKSDQEEEEGEEKGRAHSSSSFCVTRPNSSTPTNSQAALDNVAEILGFSPPRAMDLRTPDLSLHPSSGPESVDQEGHGERNISLRGSSVDGSSDEEENHYDVADSDSSDEGESGRSEGDRAIGRSRHFRSLQQRARNEALQWLAENNYIYSYFMWTQRPRHQADISFDWESVRQRQNSSGNHVDMPSESLVSAHLSDDQRQQAIYYINSHQERPWLRVRQRRRRELSPDPLFSHRPAELFGSTDGHMYKSKPRLIYSQQEPNVGRGFIKEQCFSTDGRLIVSPWGNGVRLLSFDQQCRELCDCEPSVPRKPRHLHEIRKICMHPREVLTTRFSPTHPLFVSGSLDGSVAFMTPCP